MTRKITPTYTLLNQVALTAAASNISFSNIPQNYGDLIFILDGQCSGNNMGDMYLQLNGDTASNYTLVWAYASGSVTGSGSGNRTGLVGGFTSTTDRNFITWHLMEYSSIDKHKTALSRHASGTNVHMFASRWSNTSPVTSVNIRGDASSFIAGTTVSIYGVVA